MSIGKLLLALLVAMVVPAWPAASDRYWQGASSGWFWYAALSRQAPPLPDAPPVPVPPPVAKVPAAGGLAEAAEIDAFKVLQARLENSRMIAIMAPTPANLSRYMYTQREVMERASVFADVWQRVLWAEPELDYGVGQRPTNAVAVRAWDARQRQRQQATVARLGEDHGLFYVFGPDCLYCDQMADTLARIKRRHGIEVQAVAFAGATHQAFPNAWPDNGFVAASGARRLPVLLLARLVAGEEGVTPLAYGPLADVELEERLAILATRPVGDRF